MHNPELPAELDAIVMKSLAKKVDDRYQSAAEMRTDIQRYLDGQPARRPHRRRTRGRAPTRRSRPRSSGRSEDDQQDEERKRRWPLVLLAVVILALLAAAVAFGLQLFGGAQDTQVPQVTNMTLRAATDRLEQEGLKIGAVERVNSDDVPEGRIVSQSPESGETVEEGSSVDVEVSAGSKTAVVPSVIGMSRADAEAALDDRGLTARFESRDSDAARGHGRRDRPGRRGVGARRLHGDRVRVHRAGACAERRRAPAGPGDLAAGERRVRCRRGVRRQHAVRRGDRPGSEPRRDERGGPGIHGDDHGLRLRGADDTVAVTLRVRHRGPVGHGQSRRHRRHRRPRRRRGRRRAAGPSVPTARATPGPEGPRTRAQ